MKVHARYVTSATDPAHFPPPGPPEIAFIGRSNVGKSSLINSLLGEKIAKTSSTPGRTRAINFFEVRRPGQARAELVFADLPGYGYAKLPREVTAHWPKFIEPYLEEREPLALSLVLIDTNIPPQASDRQMVEWLRRSGRAFLLVGTKADRLSGNRLRAALDALASEFEVERIVRFSARNAEGRDELWREIWAAAAAQAGEARTAS